MEVNQIIEYVALAGGLITVAAYLPQIIRLSRVKNSTGNSLSAWYLWLIGAALPLLYAFYIGDNIFIFLQIAYVVCIGSVIILIHRFRKA